MLQEGETAHEQGDWLLNAGMQKFYRLSKEQNIIEIEPNDCTRLFFFVLFHPAGILWAKKLSLLTKRKDPSSPRPPHIFNTRFFYIFINPSARAHCLMISLFFHSSFAMRACLV